MAHMELKKYSVEWAPSNYKADEANTAIFSVSAGEFVAQVAYRVLANFGANCVINVGDGANEVGYDAIATGVTNTTATFAVSDGAYVLNSCGKLYTSDDTIDIDYTAGAANASGRMRFYILKGRIEP